MNRSVRIPYPIVCIEWDTIIIMDFSIEGTIVFPVFRYAYHSFIRTIQGSVKNRLVLFTTSCHADFAKFLIPNASSCFRQNFQVIVVYFPFKIPFACSTLINETP